jgi:hypothetical protein
MAIKYPFVFKNEPVKTAIIFENPDCDFPNPNLKCQCHFEIASSIIGSIKDGFDTDLVDTVDEHIEEMRKIVSLDYNHIMGKISNVSADEFNRSADAYNLNLGRMLMLEAMILYEKKEAVKFSESVDEALSVLNKIVVDNDNRDEKELVTQYILMLNSYLAKIYEDKGLNDLGQSMHWDIYQEKKVLSDFENHPHNRVELLATVNHIFVAELEYSMELLAANLKKGEVNNNELIDTAIKNDIELIEVLLAYIEALDSNIRFRNLKWELVIRRNISIWCDKKKKFIENGDKHLEKHLVKIQAIKDDNEKVCGPLAKFLDGQASSFVRFLKFMYPL